MFKKGKLHLPENICFTNTGLLIYSISIKLPLMLMEQGN
jgi:hypothetical protein